MATQTNLSADEAILIIEDDLVTVTLYKTILEETGHKLVLSCDNKNDAETHLANSQIAAIILDIGLPGVSGIDLLREYTSDFPAIPVIMATGEESIESAVECMKLGAFDYLRKPVRAERLVPIVHAALEHREMKREISNLNQRLRDSRLENPTVFKAIVTTSEDMTAVFKYIEAVAASPQPVFITGESGTGKELLARAVHDASGRNGKFVAVNVSGLEDTIFSDTLFGHRRGAFTGADADRNGLLEEATGGSIFLDEIGDLEQPSQIKLLRLLQEREFLPLGSDSAKISDARVIAATNADVQTAMDSGKFREDLYYRLMSHRILVPPLRERIEDIPALLESFVDSAATTLGKKPPSIPDGMAALLSTYSFPGNVRELQSFIFDLVSTASGPALSMAPVRTYISGSQSKSQGDPPASLDFAALSTYFGKFPTVKKITDHVIALALKQVDNNQSSAASLLGISQSTLSRWIAGQE